MLWPNQNLDYIFDEMLQLLAWCSPLILVSPCYHEFAVLFKFMAYLSLGGG